MRKSLVMIALAAALYGGYDLYAASPDEHTNVGGGDQAPRFEVTMLDGTTVSSASLAGKVVLVNFWATWCPPCRQELKRLPGEIVERFDGKDFVLLAISRGEEPETVQKFMESAGYTFNPGLDRDASIYGLFASNYIPRNYLIGKDGRIVWISVGYDSEEFEQMVKVIEELIKN